MLMNNKLFKGNSPVYIMIYSKNGFVHKSMEGKGFC